MPGFVGADRFRRGGYSSQMGNRPTLGGSGVGGGTGAGAGYPNVDKLPPANVTSHPAESSAYQYWQKASQTPGMTPEQLQMMKNQVALRSTAGREAGMERLKQYYAGRGMGGSGMEGSEMGRYLMGIEGARQQGLTGVELRNAEMEARNRMGYTQMGTQLAGTLGGLGLGRQQLEQQQRESRASQQYYDEQAKERQAWEERTRRLLESQYGDEGGVKRTQGTPHQWTGPMGRVMTSYSY